MSTKPSTRADWPVAVVVSVTCVSSLLSCQESATTTNSGGAETRYESAGGESSRDTKSQVIANSTTSVASNGEAASTASRGGNASSASAAGAATATRSTKASAGGAVSSGPSVNVDGQAGSGGTRTQETASAHAGTRADLDTGTIGGSAQAGSGAVPEKKPYDELTPFCRGILLDNDGLPEEYPALYREPSDALDQFNTEKARLLATYGLKDSDYKITGAPITWAATISGGTGTWLPLAGGPIDASNTVAIAQAFLTEYQALFGYEGLTAAADEPYCFTKFCRTTLTQNYCGLALFSRESEHCGTTTVLIHTQAEGLYRIISQFVPMVSLPRNALVTKEQITRAVMGQELRFSCAQGERSIQVAAQDEITVTDQQTVYVRTSSTVAAALEYRMTIPVMVVVGGLPGTIYVDAIDGTVVDAVPNFICD